MQYTLFVRSSTARPMLLEVYNCQICSIDLSKAFDKVNHYALFVKLINRLFPMQLLDIIVLLFSDCVSCVKWDGVNSSMFVITSGDRQGSIFFTYIIMRPSSLGGGRILRRTLSVRLSVRPSRYRYRASRRAT